MCFWYAVNLAQVICNQAGVGGVQALAVPEKIFAAGAVVVRRIQNKIRATLMRFAHQLRNFFPGSGKIDVADIQLVAQLREIRQNALQKGTVGAVVIYACMIPERIGKVFTEEEKNVHGKSGELCAEKYIPEI